MGANLPRWLRVPALAAATIVFLPLVGLAAQIPWARIPSLLSGERALEALGLSLRTSLASTALCLLAGVPLAILLGRSRSPLVGAARVAVTLPMVLPPVVAGIALLATLGRQGILGSSLRFLGIDVAFTTLAVVAAQTFVSLPYLVISLEGAVRAGGTRYEEAAACLGQSPTRVFFTVTLPVLGPAIASSAVLAWARALGEFGATLTFAGSLAGVTRTMPLDIYLARETDTDTALALAATLLVAAALVVSANAYFARRRR